MRGRVVAAEYARRTRFYKLRKVPDIIVRRHIRNLARVLVNHNGRLAEVADVGRTALLVEDYVPVYPALRIVVEIVYNLSAVTLAVLPNPRVRRFSRGRIVRELDAALGEEKRLFGVQRVHGGKVFTLVAAIPVITYAPHQIAHPLYRKRGKAAPYNSVAVVVPQHDFGVFEPVLFQRGAEVVADKVPLFLGSVNARLPNLHRLGLVLDGQRVDGNPARAQVLYKFAIIIRPRLSVFAEKLPAVLGLIVVFHERGRAPRRNKREQPVACLAALLVKFEAPAVPFGVESFKFLVAVLDVGTRLD